MDADSRYADRFRAETYSDDGVVGIFVDPDDPAAVWVPERILARLAHVARAYELHLLPLLGASEPRRLNRTQIRTLLDEVAFVRGMLPGDELVAREADGITRYLQSLLSGRDVVVTVEGE